MTIDAAAVVAALERVRWATEAAQGDLDRLDAIAGDGDHGVTMVAGWRAVVGTLATPPGSPGAALRVAAEAFASVGGSAGPLWGTALLRAGRVLGDAPSVEIGVVAAAARAAVEGMMERGRCRAGERTVVDAMTPAADVLAHGGDLVAAADAAKAGANATAAMRPLHGRAARTPERVEGHADPGASAGAIFWAGVADCSG